MVEMLKSKFPHQTKETLLALQLNHINLLHFTKRLSSLYIKAFCFNTTDSCCCYIQRSLQDFYAHISQPTSLLFQLRFTNQSIKSIYHLSARLQRCSGPEIHLKSVLIFKIPVQLDSTHCSHSSHSIELARRRDIASKSLLLLGCSILAIRA